MNNPPASASTAGAPPTSAHPPHPGLVPQLLHGSQGRLPQWPASAPVRQVAPPQGLMPDSLTDRGNAKLFVGLYGRDFRHVPGLGWHQWSGYRWEIDEDDTVLWAAGEMAESLTETDPAGILPAAALRRHRRRALSTAGMKAMLMQARAAPGMVLNAALLDADPHALCTPGGVVDLRSGSLTPPDPERHLHSRATLLTPRAMPVPRWRRYLTDTFGEDTAGRELIAFLHELLGYSLTGEVGAQIMPFLYGRSGSGRNVLLDVVVRLLGDYADAAAPNFLTARPHTAHPADLAELHGRRIIVCAVPRPGDRVDEARVQLLTGGDRIKARRMRQDFFSFKPTHKLWLLGTHRPEPGTGGHAFWRRMKVVPAARSAPTPAERHAEALGRAWAPGHTDALSEELAEADRLANALAEALVTQEGPGILHWLITGAARYLGGSRDLSGPSRVRTAGVERPAPRDPTGRFLAERCTLDPSMRAEQTQLYNRYKKWCAHEGASPVSSRAFAARVRAAVGIATPKQMVLSNQRKFYPGIGIDTASEEVA